MDNIMLGIKEIIAGFNKDVSLLNENRDIREIGFDSIDFIHLVVKLEKRFEVFFDDQDLLIDNFNTIAKIKAFIVERL